MAGKIMKATEFRKLTADEIRKKVDDKKREIMNLRFQFARAQVANPKRLKVLRVEIARAMTVFHEKTGESL